MDNRGRHGNHARGRGQHRWTDDRMVNDDGYIKLRVGVDHPLADSNGYAYEHLVVWVSAGRERPKRGWILHHRDEDRSNNRLGNLELLSRAEHNRLHNSQRGRSASGRFLPRCVAA